MLIDVYLLVKFPNGVLAISKSGITSITDTLKPARKPIKPWIFILNKISVFLVIANKSK